MRWMVLVWMIWLGAGTIQGQPYSDSVSVNFFLLAECRISQNISGEIRQVLAQYQQTPDFTFHSYFPGTQSNRAQAEEFLATYQLELPYKIDYYKTNTQRYGATIAPQVVVYDEKNQRVLYSGRIDNSYDQVGSRRRVVTSRDLRAALAAILQQQAVVPQETEAIGCYISKD